MRNIVFVLFAATFLSCTFEADAQKRARKAVLSSDDIRVSMAFVGSPRINYAKRGGSDTHTKHPWLQVRVLYDFGKRKFPAGFTFDNVRCEVYLRTIAKKNTWRKNCWFTGTQYIYSLIPENFGGKHQVWLFMPPPLLYKATGGSSAYSQIMKDSVVFVRIYAGNRLLGTKIWLGASSGGKVDPRQERVLKNAFNRMNDNPVNKIVNGLWPQDKTPWQWLAADRMDLPQVEFDKRTAVKNDSGAEENDEDVPVSENEEDTEEKTKKAAGKAADQKDESFEDIDFTRSAGKAKRNKRGKRK